jgi:hypothetical protein
MENLRFKAINDLSSQNKEVEVNGSAKIPASSAKMFLQSKLPGIF